MVDVNSLLTPISDDKPCGTYLKLDRSAYRGLRNAYNTAQSSFRQLIETPEASSNQELLETNDTNWETLRTVTQDALEQQTKDLEILGWYIASQLFSRDPFNNFASAIEAMHGLLERHWGELNPMLPEGKRKAAEGPEGDKELAEFRLKPLLQLVGESPDSTAVFMPLQLLPLVGEISFFDYLTAERSGSLAEVKQSASSQFNSNVQETLNALSNAYQNLSQSEDVIAAHCKELGVTPISFKFIKANIADFINAIKFLVSDTFSAWPLDDHFAIAAAPVVQAHSQETVSSRVENRIEPSIGISEENNSINSTLQQSAPTTDAPAPISIENNSASIISAQGAVTNRDQAFHELRKISDYFKQAEPHSPISFLLERAIRWGYLSLPELLEEMVGKDTQMLQQINQLTGMDNLSQTDLAKKSSSSTNTALTSSGSSLSSNDPSDNFNVSDTATTATRTETGQQPSQDSGAVTSFEW
ncbi:type VI secretion system ImpA family N-terminal domain-containing protein [Vibrio sp. ZSDE26]|uniref:Type VI secretion system ImpA family N-terminal domain-containing protein n=1 Tax=Vibrio amylolyticus TaxID=2847292 RepID=A0A9X1XQB8_9VIBR|nr:type VI secretion system ImpA family N-terminal domain-containing protein [Vibrio amylolyticus]MCK6265165.1 type VI secretion system ImpA family N-terminal domain-containing protein [Vibrio amylolyticus]